ncbi:unnamed protein product [Auanema sp. JU1783]|nr:unnamed protein product [Auanema sp. JU1783]
MSYQTIEREKVCVGGVDLVNRHQLSNYQDKELQRFIDANNHLIHWVDEEKIKNHKLKKDNSPSNYANKSRAMSSEPSLRDRYNSTENLAKHMKNSYGGEDDSHLLKHPKPPSVDHANYTSEFPGIENITDNTYLSDFLNKMKSNESLNKNSRANSILSNNASNYYPTYSDSGYGKIGYSFKPEPYNNNANERSCSVPYNSNKERPESAAGAQSEYGYIDRNKNYYNSPGSTLKRKGVSWLDQERARSLSPDSHQLNMPAMSQYGSIGNLNFRDNAGSPAYSSLGKHKDNYNRFETQQHSRAHARARSPFEESRFGGFGDRPGSGVELTSHQWNGGEIISDPTAVPKGLKPRRMYYSPIGDGTVAADGYELKRRPMDLSPKVTITQLQHMDRGEKGHGGVNVYEKSWSNSVGGDGRQSAFGSEYGPGSGRSSRAGALSPADKNPYYPNYGKPGAGNNGDNHHPNDNHGLSGFPDLSDVLGKGGPKNNNLGNNNNPYGNAGTGNNFGDDFPKGGLGGLEDRYPRGLSSSPGIHDVNYKLDTKTGYLITNPRELIHQYATTTPVAVMNANDNTPSSTTVTKQSLYRKHEETTEEHFAPYAPYKSNSAIATPNNFVKQLRNETLTQRQREANQQLDPLNHKDPHSQERIQEISRTLNHTSYGDSFGKSNLY